ncbi:STAS domain-containing protein [Streptantibioticus silvisoli]|jgi:anti-sigma B factor antagonist|uniref:STAS domain-containing protein n=1 Tax=Streptantibioticus silvisoli TaxID=2705255 RepID=UPI0027E392F2|nr:STAS domain-containing protein [Streptantibioticus silvisoli]
MNPLTITTRDAATGPVLAITGDLDHKTAPDLRRTVETLPMADGQLLVVDLARMRFCDSSGINTLVAARNLAAEAGADIALAAVPANTRRILGIVGLDQVFALYPDTRTATRRHRPAGGLGRRAQPGGGARRDAEGTGWDVSSGSSG